MKRYGKNKIRVNTGIIRHLTPIQSVLPKRIQERANSKGDMVELPCSLEMFDCFQFDESVIQKDNYDGGVLVVSAITGPTLEVREEILLARQRGISKIIVFLRKCDEVDTSHIDMVIDDTKSLLADYEYDTNCPFVLGTKDENQVASDLKNAIVRYFWQEVPSRQRLRSQVDSHDKFHK